MWKPKTVPVVYVKNCKMQRLIMVALVIGTNFHFWDQEERNVQPLGVTPYVSELWELGSSAAEIGIQCQTVGSQKAGSQKAALQESHRQSMDIWCEKREGVFKCHCSSWLPCLLWVSKRPSVRETWCSWASPLTVPAGSHGQTSVENRILHSELPSCCLMANFILNDYCSLTLVVPAQISVSGNPGSGVHGLPGMLRRRMSFMQKGALIPAAFNAPAWETRSWVSSFTITICNFLHLLWCAAVNIS